MSSSSKMSAIKSAFSAKHKPLPGGAKVDAGRKAAQAILKAYRKHELK